MEGWPREIFAAQRPDNRVNALTELRGLRNQEGNHRDSSMEVSAACELHVPKRGNTNGQ